MTSDSDSKNDSGLSRARSRLILVEANGRFNEARYVRILFDSPASLTEALGDSFPTQMPTFLSHGAFADVFDLGDGTVAKVFRRIQHTNADVKDWSDHEFITRRLFRGETTAYERLQTQPDLVACIPQYYGTLTIDALDLSSSRPAEPLMADCALRLELIPGSDTKVAHVEQPLLGQIEAVLWKISELADRVNVWDSSCFIPGLRGPFTVIDFAMWDDLADAQLYLDEHGFIPEELRKLYSLDVTTA
jgi:hypothetical protein